MQTIERADIDAALNYQENGKSYYAKVDAAQAKNGIVNGVRDFADLQARFMAHLTTH